MLPRECLFPAPRCRGECRWFDYLGRPDRGRSRFTTGPTSTGGDGTLTAPPHDLAPSCPSTRVARDRSRDRRAGRPSWRRRPGAGKTTRVPRALLDAGSASGEIWVLEPRRLPARLAATRVAAELGERVGETVGYSVRFDEAPGPRRGSGSSPKGCSCGACWRQPQLPGVARSCSTSCTSATSPPISRWPGCGGCARRTARTWRSWRCPRRSTPTRSPISSAGDVVRSEGRMFDVAIEHLSAPDDRPLAGAGRRGGPPSSPRRQGR